MKRLLRGGQIPCLVGGERVEQNQQISKVKKEQIRFLLSERFAYRDDCAFTDSPVSQDLYINQLKANREDDLRE